MSFYVQEAAGLIAHCTRTTAAKIDIQPNIPTACRADILLVRAARDCRADIMQVRAAGIKRLEKLKNQ